MVELTRTLHQWRMTARRLQLGTLGRPDLAEQIRWGLPTDPHALSSAPLAMTFLADDAALIERLVPVAGWRAPPSPVGRAADVVATAEAIIAAHQRRQG